MTTFNDSESGASVRTKINAAITTVDGLGSGDNLLLTAAERAAIAANTAKTSNATHTGDVTGATALTIADEAVTIGKIATAAKTGDDTTLVTGTAGTNGQVAKWNADGDLIGETVVEIGDLTALPSAITTGDLLFVSRSGTMYAADDADIRDSRISTFGATLVDDADAATARATLGAAALTIAINAQTGTAYTPVLGDAGKKVTMSNASANALTIPTNASVAFPVGTIISVSMIGSGTTTVTGDTGVSVNGVSGGGAAISAQYTGVTLLKIGTDAWLMEGNHGAVT